MIAIQLIQAVVEYERRLKLEDEQRKNHRQEEPVYLHKTPQKPLKKQETRTTPALELSQDHQAGC